LPGGVKVARRPVKPLVAVRVVMNTETQSRTMANVAFLD